MVAGEKRRGNAPIPGEARDDEPQTMTADQVARPNVFRALDTVATTPAMPSLAPGTVVKHYEFIRQLGAGGMGTVFLARDTRLGRLVAVKLLLNYTGRAAYRFLAEARTTAQCRHDNIVVIYDVDEYAGYPYMVLEYIEGRTLRAAMADTGRDGVAFAIESMLSVTRALVRAHEMGIVHRDLKPENILLSRDGQIKVLDFGVAKQVAEVLPELTASDAPVVERMSPEQTQAGALVGTLGYMSPEQIKGEPIDGRTDIWAVGIILYELVTGERPLKGDSFTQIAGPMRTADALPSVREKRPELGPLADVIDRCLQKRKDDRFESAKELLAALERVTEGRPKSSLVSVQSTDAVTLPQPDTFDAVVPDAALKTGDSRESSNREAQVAPSSPRKTKRWRWALLGGMGLAVMGLAGAGVVMKRQTSTPLVPVVVAAIDCAAAEVTGSDVPVGFAETLGKGACARLGIELGVPWQVTGGVRLGVHAQVQGKEDARVTLELAGKTAEGTGKTTIAATNDAIQKLAPLISVPAFSAERIKGWGARDEASARRIERGFRRVSFQFAERKTVAEALVQSDPDSAIPHALLACSLKNDDLARARTEKAEAYKRFPAMDEKRAKLIAGELGTFVPTPDDKHGAQDMLDAYTALSHDPDFAGLYTMCGCILTDTSLPMVDWLYKNERLMGLPMTRCSFFFSREMSPERNAQYLTWQDSTLPELRGSRIYDMLKLGQVDDARTALSIKEILGAEKTPAFEVADERNDLALAVFDWKTALKAGDALLGEPDFQVSHGGAIARIHAFLMAGQVTAALLSTRAELGRLHSKEYDRDFFELAWMDFRLRRLLGRSVAEPGLIQRVRERLKQNPFDGAGMVAELALLPANEGSAKEELDRLLGDSDPEFKKITSTWRTVYALPLLRRVRGNEAAATAYREMDFRSAKWFGSFDAALLFEAIGSKAEAEKAYRLSMEEPWYHAFEAMAARVRLADMLRADGREDEAREMMAVVDKAWTEADPGLREAVRKLK